MAETEGQDMTISILMSLGNVLGAMPLGVQVDL